MTRTLSHPAAVQAPRIRRFKLLLAWLHAAAVALLALVLALPRLLSRDEQGHLKTVHWVLLTIFFGAITYAPFNPDIVPPHRHQHFDYFGGPMFLLFFVTGFCGAHAIGKFGQGGQK